MAKQQTTKRAAAWKPPRLTMLNARGATGSGTRPHNVRFEGSCPGSPNVNINYRMPFSSDSPSPDAC